MSIASAFLSHATPDKPIVEAVGRALARRGVAPWLDTDQLSVGQSLIEKLREAVQQQEVFVLFLSKKSMQSDWVDFELQQALSEAQDDRLLPVFLDDPLEWIRSKPFLSERWLHPDGNKIGKLGVAASRGPRKRMERAEQIADQLATAIYDRLRLKEALEINLAIDQRGRGRRGERYRLPPNIAKLDNPTLVFRPDLGKRSFAETLHGDVWSEVRSAFERALGNVTGSTQRLRKVRVLGEFQLGFAYWIGRFFDRTSFVSLYCHHMRRQTVFNNDGQDRNGPLRGGEERCETVGPPTQNVLPHELDADSVHPQIALYIGKREYLPNVKDHLNAQNSAPRLVFVEIESTYSDSSQVMKLAADVAALLGRLKREHRTREARFYCDLPVNALPLLAANLTHTVDLHFMEYRRDLQDSAAPAAEMFAMLPMK